MATKKEKIAGVLSKYLPEVYVPYIIELMFSAQVAFTISKPRKTKAGDYRPPFKGKPHRISVNGNLNQYAFLITTIHEFAHMTTYIKHGNKVKAHGLEWKSEFRRLLLPVLEKKELPHEIEKALMLSLHNLKASSCTDIHLQRALKKFDENNNSLVLLETLEHNVWFRLGRKTFQRGELQRKRYLCKEVITGREYFINRLAEVEPIKETK